MKETVEVYEQGTGKLIDTYTIEVPDRPPIDVRMEIATMRLRLDELEAILPAGEG